MLLDGQYNIQQQYLNKTKGNGYEGMSPEQESYWRKDNANDIKDGMLGLGEGLLSAPIGAAEAAFGLPMDVYGAAKGGYAAYNADEGKGFDAFEKEFNDTPMTTQWIQGYTNKVLPSWMQKGMGSEGRYIGEFAAPGGYFKILKALGLGKKEITGASLLGGGSNIE